MHLHRAAAAAQEVNYAQLTFSQTINLFLLKRDIWDHNPDDRKLTVYCIPPTTPGAGDGSWSIHPSSAVPDCVSICQQFIPQADFQSDLVLTHVIEYNDPAHPVSWTEKNKTDSFLYSGDRLRFCI